MTTRAAVPQNSSQDSRDTDTAHPTPDAIQEPLYPRTGPVKLYERLCPGRPLRFPDPGPLGHFVSDFSAPESLEGEAKTSPSSQFI